VSRPLGSTELKRLHRSWRQHTNRSVALLLDNVMTPYNVGSIVRLAAAYRASPVLLCGATVALGHAGVRKTALGTERMVDATVLGSGADGVAAAHAAGFRVVGIELAPDATPLFSVTLGPATCFAVGHEDHGLSPAVLAGCDDVAYLPLVGRVGSLNVATAVAIALYEARRQEWFLATGAGDRPRS
jgi:tRNA (guanosine-2'-O-)-methyltransferase